MNRRGFMTALTGLMATAVANGIADDDVLDWTEEVVDEWDERSSSSSSSTSESCSHPFTGFDSKCRICQNKKKYLLFYQQFDT